MRPLPLFFRRGLGNVTTLGNVTGLAEPFTLEVIVTGTIIHLCIDDRYTLIARSDDHAGEKLRFFSEGAEATCEAIEVRTLVGP